MLIIIRLKGIYENRAGLSLMFPSLDKLEAKDTKENSLLFTTTWHQYRNDILFLFASNNLVQISIWLRTERILVYLMLLVLKQSIVIFNCINTIYFKNQGHEGEYSN